MSDDTISRQAAIATAISGRVRTLPTTEDGENWIRVNEVRDSLLSLPSAERHGHWEFIGGYGYQYRCSVCVTCAERKTKFCSNCGAKMDGGIE